MFEDGYWFGFNAFFGILSAAFLVLIGLFIFLIIDKTLYIVFALIKSILKEAYNFAIKILFLARIKQFFATNPRAMTKIEELWKQGYACEIIAEKTGYPEKIVRRAVVGIHENFRQKLQNKKE